MILSSYFQLHGLSITGFLKLSNYQQTGSVVSQMSRDNLMLRGFRVSTKTIFKGWQHSWVAIKRLTTCLSQSKFLCDSVVIEPLQESSVVEFVFELCTAKIWITHFTLYGICWVNWLNVIKCLYWVLVCVIYHDFFFTVSFYRNLFLSCWNLRLLPTWVLPWWCNTVLSSSLSGDCCLSITNGQTLWSV